MSDSTGNAKIDPGQYYSHHQDPCKFPEMRRMPLGTAMLYGFGEIMDRLKAIEAKTESLGKFTLNEEELKKMLATIMGMFRTLEAKLDALGADHFIFRKDAFHPIDTEPLAYPPPVGSQGTVYTGLVVDSHANGHTPPLAPADLRGHPIASEADCLTKDPPAKPEPEDK